MTNQGDFLAQNLKLTKHIFQKVTDNCDRYMYKIQQFLKIEDMEKLL